jgi:hypothetical protein
MTEETETSDTHNLMNEINAACEQKDLDLFTACLNKYYNLLTHEQFHKFMLFKYDLLNDVECPMRADLGNQCYDLPDNCPYDWTIYLSLTDANKLYVRERDLNTGISWLTFDSNKEMDVFAAVDEDEED